MKKSRAMYIPAGGKKAVWGPIDQNVLPEGYPYKEGTVIEWDGNTEGREHTAAMGMEFYWVSPEILTDEEIKNGKVVSNDGNVEEIAKYWDQFVSGGNVTEDATLTSSVAVVRKANAEVAGAVFSTPGVYFTRIELGGNVGFISKFSNETIHPMAPEFLPALTSPNGTKYQLTVADDGTLSAVAVS